MSKASSAAVGWTDDSAGARGKVQDHRPSGCSMQGLCLVLPIVRAEKSTFATKPMDKLSETKAHHTKFKYQISYKYNIYRYRW